MSRFRPSWLDRDGGEPPAIEESRFRLSHEPRTSHRVSIAMLVFLFMPQEDPVDIAAPTVRSQGLPALTPTNLA